ncbi:uncharacterized protein VDAG_04644 [Verticillium dahliae VdLs.17]|uniref:Uncharacterized protein n=1 Tax=Verticillium dahliae (strain VdLs.17 / ATCC MYA-4575 / FGSC 10137) TaxID=498257 RepID=G2X3Q7_VERDV|nr:uncharacterized protein VDAG_04644 [Verticillium dahliae VdLs.17]EGY23206.1 hypothetical protein VDAG_04644 [Verticillium dahliae VdLs.17]
MPSAQRPVFTPESPSRFYPTTRVVTAIPNNPPPDYPISVLGKIKYALRRKAARAAAAERTPQTPQTTYHTNERGQIIETRLRQKPAQASLSGYYGERVRCSDILDRRAYELRRHGFNFH